MTDRICSNCDNAYQGGAGVFCMVYREVILDESVAAECEAFDLVGQSPEWRCTRTGLRALPQSLPQVYSEADAAVEVEAAVEADVTVVIRTSGRACGKGVEVLSGSSLVEACERYLQSRHSTLWGQSWNIISSRDRGEAAKWLASQIVAIGAKPDEGPG